MAVSMKNENTPLYDFDLEFVDPRTYRDRRDNQPSNEMPISGDRRHDRRRKIPYLYNDSWWLKRTYHYRTRVKSLFSQ